MPNLRSLPADKARNPQQLLAIWRVERAVRTGRLICYAAIILAVVATAADLTWTSIPLAAWDLILLIGASASLYLVRQKNPPAYFWWPLFIGGWITAISTFYTTGGLMSPFFAISIAALYLVGATLDHKGRSTAFLIFALAHIPVFCLFRIYHPLPVTSPMPPLFVATVQALILASVCFCQLALLRTERKLSGDFASHFNVIEKAHQEMREAQSIALVGSFEWDLQTDRIWWSDQLYEMFEVPRDSFDPSYSAYLERLPPAVRTQMEEVVSRSIETGEDYSMENERPTSKGTKYFFSRGRPIRDAEGKVVKIRGTCQDITDRKRIEAQLNEARLELEKRVEERTQQLAQSLEREKTAKEAAEHASQAKMQFLANMSHEIRTPMNSILGFSELLGNGTPTQKEIKEFLARIHANGRRLMHLIDDILDLSKFEAGRIPVQKAAFEPRPFIEDMVASFSPALADRGLELRLEFGDEVPRRISTDAQRMGQVISNLLSNSIKFSEYGTICLRVSGEARIQIDVEDCGIGISPENHGALFKPFSQGDGSVARKFGGSGLGLALSRRIAEALGGGLELQKSIPGQGSHFRFWFPVERAQVAAADSTAPEAAGADRALKGKRVLLAEDSPDNAFLISHFIRSAGGEVDVVGDGVKAVEAAGREIYDFILMDIQMPDMDGLEASRRIRAAGIQKPIVALTAHALPAEAEKSLRAGCNAHLTKPISREVLISSLRQVSL